MDRRWRIPVVVLFVAVVTVSTVAFIVPVRAVTRGLVASSGTAMDCCGGASSWTTGNKLAVGTSATTGSMVWFTVAKGITSEIFYPRADVPNMQDMQYVVTDKSTFIDLERDATDHVVSMPDENALEYTVTNTAKTGRYRITNTYVTDPTRNTLLINTRFQSLGGGRYQLYILENPSLAGGAANDNAWWDGAHGALLSSDTQKLFGSSTTVASAVKVSSGSVHTPTDTPAQPAIALSISQRIRRLATSSTR
jgi:glucoamylase